MPTAQQLRERLTDKLRELFQLNQPDLDFGFYRIMHAKSKQVTEFLEQDLLAIVEQAFGDDSEAKIAELRKAYEDAIEQAKKFGADKPEETDPVKEAKADLDAAADTSKAEGEVYDHLYRFFERYYEDGDFISRRYYARETGSKAAAYAIPYSGEEVKLHWANADQYYIKTAEHFNHFSFDLAQAQEVSEHAGELFADQGDPETMRVHFQVVEASEGEHGNVKTSEATKRFFIIHEGASVGFDDSGELVCRFEFRPDPDKTGQDRTWRERRNNEAVATILDALDVLAEESDSIAEGVAPDAIKQKAKAYAAALRMPSPTERSSSRPVLARYINQYTARNTMDYFIHKDLGGFLRRELDFYIKNEVMRLDDIESADAPRVEQYLGKLKVLRSIASKIIDFLAQLEDFQKRLWLKKKFVVETNYCITLDHILAIEEEQTRDWLLEQIAANDAQREEWVHLFAIDEIDGSDAAGPVFEGQAVKYSEPLTIEFLKANSGLVLDTCFFEHWFVARLLPALEQLPEHLLVHSENFQALQFLHHRYANELDYIYIDPPYNTNSTPILYKNSYRHSSWASLMRDRVAFSLSMLRHDGVKTIAIDDTEMVNLSHILTDIAPEHRLSRITVVHNPKGSITKDFNRVHEYALFLTRETVKECIARTLEKNETPRKMRRWGENSRRTDRRLSFYPIYVKDGKITRIGEVPDDEFHPPGRNVELPSGEIEIWPIDQDGVERRWNFGLDTIEDNADRITIREVDDTLDLFLTHEKTVPKTVWTGGDYDAGNYGNTLLISILGEKRFDFPKSIKLVTRCIDLATQERKESVVMDYFAGSGTTGHAVIELLRSGTAILNYILVEMGAHFDTVLKPRLVKIIYAKNWRDGKPSSRDTSTPHAFKYIRLESYEDCLNNLEMTEDKDRQKLLAGNPELREDYVLRYMLDVETRGSQSLLNVDTFADPTAYNLRVKRPGSDEYTWKNVDLLETFNYLLGLRVEHIAVPQTFTAEFERPEDPELPEDQNTRLQVAGWSGLDAQGRVKNRGTFAQAEDGPWLFRKVEGWAPADPNHPNNGQREKVLIVWRKLTGDLEQDNLMLDCWFQANRISTRDFEFDTIYVNGSNNLPNLKLEGDQWKVRLIEEDFHRLMWDVEEI